MNEKHNKQNSELDKTEERILRYLSQWGDSEVNIGEIQAYLSEISDETFDFYIEELRKNDYLKKSRKGELVWLSNLGKEYLTKNKSIEHKSTPKQTCKAKNKKNESCKNHTMKNSDYCYMHSFGKFRGVPWCKNSTFHFIATIILTISLFLIGPSRSNQNKMLKNDDETHKKIDELKQNFSEVEKIILTFSFEVTPLSIYSIYTSPYLKKLIYEKLSEDETKEIWALYENLESLTDKEMKSKEWADIFIQRYIGVNGKKEAYLRKAPRNTEEYAEFVKRCNTKKFLKQISDEIFNDWKMNFYISGDGKAFFVRESQGKDDISKYYFYEYFGKQGRLQVIYHLPITNPRKLRNLSDFQGKIVEFKLRNMKYLDLTPVSLAIDFSEKHLGEDSEVWEEKLTTKTIFFALDIDSKDWHDLPEWKRKHSLITKKEDGDRIIWEGEYTIPNNFFRKNTIKK